MQSQFTLDSSTVTIPLSQGQVALIDAADYPRISTYRWHAVQQKTRDGKPTGVFYASTNIGKSVMLMHRLIMDAPKGALVDHANRNSLDNRRSNLRFATPRQNAVNSKRVKRASVGGFRGVMRATKSPHRWTAVIGTPNGLKHLGYFDTPEDAAIVYDFHSKRINAEFAVLNFPDESRPALPKHPVSINVPYDLSWRFRDATEEEREWISEIVTEALRGHFSSDSNDN